MILKDASANLLFRDLVKFVEDGRLIQVAGSVRRFIDKGCVMGKQSLV